MTFAELKIRTASRLGEPSDTTLQQYYTPAEIGVAINAVNRLFCLLSLCLETTGTLTLSTDGRPYYRMLNVFADWLLPLRVRITGGAKVKPSRESDLGALSLSWKATSGVPERYVVTGFDLFGIYKQPTVATTLDVTYARCPAFLQNDTDVPEIDGEYHPELINGAIPLLRTKEGAQEWQKVLPLWDRYMAAAKKEADYVRARAIEQGYDRMPFELEQFDSSVYLEGLAKV